MANWYKYEVLGMLNGKLVTENCGTKKNLDTTIARLKKQGMELKAIKTRYDKPKKK